MSKTDFTAAAVVDWQSIDTVLLDMDGTLLDLRFDNYFWQELIPTVYAEQTGMSLAAAQAHLQPIFAARQGSLDWYCVEFWSRELELDIVRLKQEASTEVRFLAGAEAFLKALQHLPVQRVLVTNAHPETLRIKAAITGIARYFDALVSSHLLRYPKEHAQFWSELHQVIDFEPQRTLFIDDSFNVLRAARAHGIKHIVAIARPDSTLAARVIEEFPAITSVATLLDSLQGRISS